MASRISSKIILCVFRAFTFCNRKSVCICCTWSQLVSHSLHTLLRHSQGVAGSPKLSQHRPRSWWSRSRGGRGSPRRRKSFEKSKNAQKYPQLSVCVEACFYFSCQKTRKFLKKVTQPCILNSSLVQGLRCSKVMCLSMSFKFLNPDFFLSIPFHYLVASNISPF